MTPATKSFVGLGINPVLFNTFQYFSSHLYNIYSFVIIYRAWSMANVPFCGVYASFCITPRWLLRVIPDWFG